MTSVFSKAVLLAGAMALGGVTIAAAAPEAGVEQRVVMLRGGDGPGDGMAGGPGMRRMHHPDPARHAQHLRDVLQLTAAQEPALQAFLAATKPPEHPGHPGPEGDKGERKPMTTPERLDRKAEGMAKRQAAFETRAAATRAFYGQLTAAQKKAFDALPPPHGPRKMRGPGGPGGERPM